MDYQMIDGSFSLHVAVYTSRLILFRLAEGDSLPLRIKQLIREKKLPYEPIEVRDANGNEVSSYFSRHPDKLSDVTDSRGSTKAIKVKSL